MKLLVPFALLAAAAPALAQKKAEPWTAPKLPGDKAFVTDTSDQFLKPPTGLAAGVTVAKVPPTIDFTYFPGQAYAGKPWSAWGESTFANGKY